MKVRVRVKGVKVRVNVRVNHRGVKVNLRKSCQGKG